MASGAQERLPAERIIADYKRGDLARAIAARYGCTVEGVYSLLRRHGVPKRGQRRGASHPNYGAGSPQWKGGAFIDGNGYRLVHVNAHEADPIARAMRRRNGYVYEHRLVMARHLGRPLGPNETVHHKDGDKLNNTLANLQLRVAAHGPGQAWRCDSCGSRDIVADALGSGA